MHQKLLLVFVVSFVSIGVTNVVFAQETVDELLYKADELAYGYYSDVEDVWKGIEIYDQILAIDPNHEFALSNKAGALEMLGENDEALIWIDKSLKLYPDDAWSISKKGKILKNLGDPDYQEYFDRALAIDPDIAHDARIYDDPKKLQTGIYVVGALVVVGFIGFVFYMKKRHIEPAVIVAKKTGSTPTPKEKGRKCKVCNAMIPADKNACPSCGDTIS